MTLDVGNGPDREVRKLLRRLGQGCVRVSRTSDLAVDATTWTIVAFDTVAFDPCGWYNTTNGRYTPKQPGYYSVSAFLAFAAAETSSIALAKNGTETVIGRSTDTGVGGTILFEANGVDDYFQIKVYTADSATVTGATPSLASFHFVGYSKP